MPWFHPAVLAAVMIAVTGIGVGGCANPVMTGGAQLAFEDRSTDDQVTDTKIGAGILKRMVETDKSLLLDVGVDVWEQRVLLTGTLDNEGLRRTVADLVRTDARIRAVHDEIQIVSKALIQERREMSDKAKAGAEAVGQTVSDVWIETKVKAKLVAARGITSVNFRWRSVLGTVYLIGRARGAWERDTVIATIRETEGVKGIVPFIEIKAPGAA